MFTGMTSASDKCVLTLDTWLIHKVAFHATYYVEVRCNRYLITGLLRGLKKPLYNLLRKFLLQVCNTNFLLSSPSRLNMINERIACNSVRRSNHIFLRGITFSVRGCTCISVRSCVYARCYILDMNYVN